jgi:hypothetical protein
LRRLLKYPAYTIEPSGEKWIQISQNQDKKLALVNTVISILLYKFQQDAHVTEFILSDNSDDYSNKVHAFLTEDKFQTLQKNTNDKYQKLLLKTLQQSNLVINKKQIKHLMQKNPKLPTLKAQLKIHKPGNPSRPVTNNMNAPSYNIAKHLVNKLNGYLCLNNQYNVKNTISLADDLTKLKINEHHKMVIYDIKNLYVNIPITETLMITKSILLKHNDTQVTKQIITLLETILQQNYFLFENNLYQPEKETSMGSPISNTIAEIFLQHIENTHPK